MTRAYPLDFVQEGNVISPADMKLHDLAVKFAEQYLAAMPNFREYHRLWVECEVDENDQPIRVVSMLAVQPKFDIPLARFTEGSTNVLMERCNAFLADKGLRNQEVTIYVARHEAKEQRCPRWKRRLKSIGAKPGDRWVAQVK